MYADPSYTGFQKQHMYAAPDYSGPYKKQPPEYDPRQVAQEEHEKSLQAAEQQRRAYDSETARLLGQQKNVFLDNLVSGATGYRRLV